jgi:phage terminase large subunit-like protein
MADLFLREVERMHQLRRNINEMTPEEADELIRGLGDDAAEDWVFAARDAQLPPPDLSWCWLFLGGLVKQAAERVHQRGERDSNMIRIREVSASRGKVMRAEPISLLYEKQRVLHRHGLDQLEGEMMAFSREWDRAVDGSPNRLDAMVWGLTRLSKVITHIPIA